MNLNCFMFVLVLALWYNIIMKTYIGYKSNKNVVYSCKYHVIWCPKYRRPVLDDEIAERLKSILYEKAKGVQAEIIELEIMPDHAHVLLEVDPQLGINKLVRHLKGSSLRILRQEFPKLESRLPSLWTNSYFVSSVGGTSLDVVKQYIENQKGV